MPALSREVSFPSSHRSFRGRRKPWGGGPAGVAERRAAVVNVAIGEIVRAERGALMEEATGRDRASLVIERADAIVVFDVAVARCE